MFRRLLLLVGAMLLLSAGVFTGYAASQMKPDAGVQPFDHDALITANGGAKRLMVQQQDDATSITSTSFTQLTIDKISVPATGKYRVVARFSGESQCNAVSWCSLRILVGGVEAFPQSGLDFAFDSPPGNCACKPWSSNAIERTSAVINGGVGSVNVEVQVAAVSGGIWRLDDWSVSAELWKV
jgi:hypothetical protein